VVRTRAETFGFDVIVDADKVLDHQDVFGVLLQQVGTTGEVHDYGALIAELKSRKVVVSVAADFMALVLLTARANRARISYSALRTLRRADGLRRPARGVLRRER
jgi:glycine cleavage system pyridoxal-binding protein P